MSTETETEAAGAAEGSLLDTILSETKLAPGDEAYDVTKQGVQAFISEMLKGRDSKKIDKAAVDSMIAELDRKLSEQVNLILHHEDFQKLEGAWRGLHYLVNNTETDETLKIRVMNISKQDLGKTLKKYKGTAWDQSPLFKRIYEDEYGTPGGAP